MLTLQLPYNGDEAESDYSNITDSSFNTSALESSTDSVYGTRPPLPQDLPEEYDIVKEIFNWCTEIDYLKRPSAKDILTRLQVFTTS
ncbi:hypothetical protein O3M35_002289 [Rhynocoris fuscipes]|uniref:Serine-threonine/tyrosine-protein kinase catalytic domain-containing protein n=1 Tax=Rhynocoris fuscipes TaxID=488301 RepID=A0AAW1CNX6_9HEMI